MILCLHGLCKGSLAQGGGLTVLAAALTSPSNPGFLAGPSWETKDEGGKGKHSQAQSFASS